MTRAAFVSPGSMATMDDTRFVVGQLAGPGTYRCESCGAERAEHALSFVIEACACGGQTFRRVD
jgi:hypothetical protein